MRTLVTLMALCSEEMEGGYVERGVVEGTGWLYESRPEL